ncbi:MAG: ribosomal protection-like ABC-F family protein [Massiliimalia sp.]|jgi:lincosamide and streptogramin A transport system ATP-binding/permease protein
MSLIHISDLTFAYDGSYEPVFQNVSFQIDTDWKLGFIGRNGRGKTTFLNLLMGKYPYSGTISASVSFDYFPFPVLHQEQNTLEVVKNIVAPFRQWEQQMEQLLADGSDQALEQYGTVLELYMQHDGYTIDELIEREIRKLDVTPEVLSRPFETLSNGERTKLMLAALFLKKNNFLLIDEPTNHLDRYGREVMGRYLSGKSGFILVSHDRYLLDQVVDHVLSINLANIEIQRGNYSSWSENKRRQDAYELSENEKLKKEIHRMAESAARTAGWSQELEKTKIGTHAADRGFIGHKSAKMMKRAKAVELRRQRAMDEKSQLLKNLEQADTLKMNLLEYHKQKLLECADLTLFYGEKPVCGPVRFQLNQGERIALHGKNGCGKSTLLRLLGGIQPISYTGTLLKGSGLIISYVSQDTSFLRGNLKDFAQSLQIDESLFKAILRKLDFTRGQFEKNMEDFSGGQKKKVLIAASLSQKAHLYLWDEPLNFVDILSRVQIEELILEYQPTMIFVEHDRVFEEKVATKMISLDQSNFL